MTTTVATSQNFAGVLYNLSTSGSIDSLIVPDGVTLVETGTSSLVVLGSEDSATVGGDVYGASGTAFTVAGALRLLSTGDVSSDSIAVRLQGSNATIVNAGTITGAGGIAPITNATTALSLNNSGTIAATGSAVTAGSGSSIVNTGRISSSQDNSTVYTIYITGGSSSFLINNSGTILGSGEGIVVSSGINGVITNTGVISAGSYAIETGGAVDIFNFGSITGNIIGYGSGSRLFNQSSGTMDTYIANFFGAQTTASISIYNDGRIADSVTLNGNVSAGVINSGWIGSGGVSGGSGDLYVQNTGVIAGYLQASTTSTVYSSGEISALLLGVGVDKVVNAGVIDFDSYLYGGNDTYDGTQGVIKGLLSGGQGDDVLLGGAAKDVFYGDNTSGDTSGGNDLLMGGRGDDVLYGGFGNDQLYGNQDNDVLYGNQGDDWMHGGQGDDVIYGGQGNDTINGGVGDDIMVGGLGNDIFVFSPGFGHDTISDFGNSSGNVDVIQFQPGTFANFADVQAHMQQLSGGVLITDTAGDTLFLVGATTGGLTSSQFGFG